MPVIFNLTSYKIIIILYSVTRQQTGAKLNTLLHSTQGNFLSNIVKTYTNCIALSITHKGLYNTYILI